MLDSLISSLLIGLFVGAALATFITFIKMIFCGRSPNKKHPMKFSDDLQHELRHRSARQTSRSIGVDEQAAGGTRGRS